MLAKFLVSLAPLAAWFVVACSDGTKPQTTAQGGAGVDSGGSAGASNPSSAGTAGGLSASGGSGDHALIVPEGIDVSAHVGNNSVFSVLALTIREESAGPALYAAVTNSGDIGGCNASFSVTLYDKDEQTLGAGVSGLMQRRFYRVTDGVGAGNVAGCVLPGDVTMVAITNLSMDAPIETVQSVVYSSQYWTLSNVVPIDGATLSGVTTVNRSGGVAYTGALVNGFDMPLSNPTVAIYPTNAVGRPLGVAYGGAMLDVAPGASWNFETDTVSDAGVGFDAYPLGGP